ncbi:unnamed protein product [Alternaria alternata]
MSDAPLYSQLPHQRAIRLLRIKSGTGDDGIQITLETFDLDSKTQFTALSYVWGDEKSPCKITCDGHKKPVRRNLWGVLSQLRKQRFDSLLWVDAICINQNDKEEKSFQVAMMRDIYKRAAKVIFWLGEQERYDEDAVNLMRGFFKRYPHRLDLEKSRVKTLEEMGFSYSDQRWAGWASLFRRPWFGRAWIVQEFLNAKTSVFVSGELEIPTELLVHCGYATGVCVAIRKAVAMHSMDAHDINKDFLRLQALRIYQFSDDIRIFDLWCWSQQLEATDTRDRVFALLSTQTAVNMDMIDYRKDEATVYTEIATKALNIPVPRIISTGKLVYTTKHQIHWNDMRRVSRFLACKFRSLQPSNLPSWVPDWKPSEFNVATTYPLCTSKTGNDAPPESFVKHQHYAVGISCFHEAHGSEKTRGMRLSHHCFAVSIANRKVIRVLGKLEILELDENFDGHYMMAQDEFDLDRIALTFFEAAGDAVDEQALISRIPVDKPW